MLKIIILSFLIAAHPVHVSLMSVEYSEEKNVFNVFIKINSDDFLLDYKLLTGDSSKIDFNENGGNGKKVIVEYLNEKIQIFAEGQKLVYKLISYESSDGELKLNLVFNNKEKSKKYLVRNHILTDIYKDQSNLLIFRFGSYEEGIKLTPENQEQTFELK
jgi:hypothetical protein